MYKYFGIFDLSIILLSCNLSYYWEIWLNILFCWGYVSIFFWRSIHSWLIYFEVLLFDTSKFKIRWINTFKNYTVTLFIFNNAFFALKFSLYNTNVSITGPICQFFNWSFTPFISIAIIIDVFESILWFSFLMFHFSPFLLFFVIFYSISFQYEFEKLYTTLLFSY